MRELWKIIGVMLGLIALYLVLTNIQRTEGALRVAFRGTQGIFAVLQGRNPATVGAVA